MVSLTVSPNSLPKDEYSESEMGEEGVEGGVGEEAKEGSGGAA